MDTDLDILFEAYQSEETHNITDYTNRLITHYVFTISYIYCNFLTYHYSVRAILQHKNNNLINM